MKLDCKIKIQDRQRTNGSSTLKAAKGIIGLAKSNGDEWVLIVRLFKDTSATQYKVQWPKVVNAYIPWLPCSRIKFLLTKTFKILASSKRSSLTS